MRTFLLPLQPGKDDEGNRIDYGSTFMDPVWDAIEESGLPVSHHIGENPPANPNEFNALPAAMLQSVAPFRDVFGRYIFGGAHWSELSHGRIGFVATIEQEYRVVSGQLTARRLLVQTQVEF